MNLKKVSFKFLNYYFDIKKFSNSYDLIFFNSFKNMIYLLYNIFKGIIDRIIIYDLFFYFYKKFYSCFYLIKLFNKSMFEMNFNILQNNEKYIINYIYIIIFNKLFLRSLKIILKLNNLSLIFLLNIFYNVNNTTIS